MLSDAIRWTLLFAVNPNAHRVLSIVHPLHHGNENIIWCSVTDRQRTDAKKNTNCRTNISWKIKISNFTKACRNVYGVDVPHVTALWPQIIFLFTLQRYSGIIIHVPDSLSHSAQAHNAAYAANACECQARVLHKFCMVHLLLARCAISIWIAFPCRNNARHPSKDSTDCRAMNCIQWRLHKSISWYTSEFRERCELHCSGFLHGRDQPGHMRHAKFTYAPPLDIRLHNCEFRLGAKRVTFSYQKSFIYFDAYPREIFGPTKPIIIRRSRKNNQSKTLRVHMCAPRTETACSYCVWKGCTKFECISRVCPVWERCVRFDDNDDYYDAHQQHHIPKTEIQKGNFPRCVFRSDSKTEYDVCALETRCCSRPEEERQRESGGEPGRERKQRPIQW